MKTQENILTLPRPEDIRLRLSQSLRESARLRRLLRLSEQATALQSTGVSSCLIESQQRATEGQQRQLDDVARRQAESEGNRKP